MSTDHLDDEKVPFAYLDLLASALTEHEKKLDGIIEKLEKITENLMRLMQTGVVSKKMEFVDSSETSNELVCLRIKINRPIEDIEKIIKLLKE